MAKVKNVIKGCVSEYGVEEMMIQNKDSKIIFWGTLEAFYKPGVMEERRKNVENSEVLEKRIWNNKKLYLVIDF